MHAYRGAVTAYKLDEIRKPQQSVNSCFIVANMNTIGIIHESTSMEFLLVIVS